MNPALVLHGIPESIRMCVNLRNNFLGQTACYYRASVATLPARPVRRGFKVPLSWHLFQSAAVYPDEPEERRRNSGSHSSAAIALWSNAKYSDGMSFTCCSACGFPASPSFPLQKGGGQSPDLLSALALTNQHRNFSRQNLPELLLELNSSGSSSKLS
jgi:hypothetical protein